MDWFMNKNNYNLRNINSGFSLLEIMISGFILALGLLGLAGMQSMAVKSTVEVQQRNLANSLVMDITQRMLLNQMWLSEAGNKYDIDSLTSANLSVPSCVDTSGTFTSCTGENIKNNDLYEWKQKFNGAGINADGTGKNGLIDADACIVSTSSGTNGELVEVVISWFSTVESKDAAAASDSTDLTATCGTASNFRRQLSVQAYINKS